MMLVGLPAGIVTWYFGRQGRLGYRLSGELRSLIAGAALALAGPALAMFAFSGIRTNGAVAFTTEAGIVVLVVVAVHRALSGRFSTVGKLIVPFIGLAVLMPGVASSVMNTAVTMMIVPLALLMVYKMIVGGFR